MTTPKGFISNNNCDDVWGDGEVIEKEVIVPQENVESKTVNKTKAPEIKKQEKPKKEKIKYIPADSLGKLSLEDYDDSDQCICSNSDFIKCTCYCDYCTLNCY